MSRQHKRHSKTSHRRHIIFLPGHSQGQRMRGPQAHIPPRGVPREMYNVFQVDRPSVVPGVSHVHAGPSNHGSLIHTATGVPHQPPQRTRRSTGPPPSSDGPSSVVQPVPMGRSPLSSTGRVDVAFPQALIPPTRNGASHSQMQQGSNANVGHSAQHTVTYFADGQRPYPARPVGPEAETTMSSSGPPGPLGRSQASSATEQSPFPSSNTGVQLNSQNSLDEEDLVRLRDSFRNYPENGDQPYGYGTPGESGMF